MCILTPSDDETRRLNEAFQLIASMQGRLKIIELAERISREKPRSLNRDLPAGGHRDLAAAGQART